jgi:hypothetical protein
LSESGSKPYKAGDSGPPSVKSDRPIFWSGFKSAAAAPRWPRQLAKIIPHVRFPSPSGRVGTDFGASWPAGTFSVTELAQRILRPTKESSEIEAKREALLKPRIFGEFLRDYDGNAFSRQDIALNVLESKGVPRDKTAEVLDRLLASAISVGFIEEIKGKNMCHLRGMAQLPRL